MNITLVLPRSQRRRIERRFRKTRDKIEARRCQILLLMHDRHSAGDISARVRCAGARATVYRTLYRFEELGEAGLRIPFRGRRKIIRAIQGLVGRASEGEEIFYLDEADIDLNPRIGLCYMKRGKQLVVPTPGKNEKRYVAGALNARTGRVIHTYSRSKCSGLFLSLLEKMKAAYRRAEKLQLILDNCSTAFSPALLTGAQCD